MAIRSQQGLEMELSRLKSFETPSLQLEQYATPSSLAAAWVWAMAMKGEVRGKVILDAACGPGILGVGLLLMGAKKLFFVDKDPAIMRICRENYEAVKKKYKVGAAAYLVQDISLFNTKVDLAVQNPPFGTKEKHLDKKFLEKAFSVAPVVYSMHKYSTRKFIAAIARDFGFTVTHVWKHEFPINAAFHFHRKPVRKIEVGLWRMEK